MEQPELGTKMYFVEEHLYYVPDHAGPLKEYCVCEGEVRGTFTVRSIQIRLIGLDPKGHVTPYYFILSDIGKKLFYTPHEAAALAREVTEEYEQRWACVGILPMRRPWAHLLEESPPC